MTLVICVALLAGCLLGGARLGRATDTVGPADLADARLQWRARPVDAFLALGIVVATPIAAWWLIGDLSFRGVPSLPLDYAYRAPEISDRSETLFGAVALVMGVVCGGRLVLSARSRRLDARWLFAVACLTVAGVLIAAIGRVDTAGVRGANIGAGLAMFFGLPVVFALVGAALLRGRRIYRSAPDPRASGVENRPRSH